MTYGPTSENLSKIFSKAKEKADGCYQMLGVAYRVRGGRVTHYAHNGKVLELFGHFNVVVGQYDGYSEAALKTLKGMK